MGTYVLSSGYYDAYYARAQKVRTLIKRDFDAVFSKVDALITPCAPTPAFKFGEHQDPLTMYLNDLFTIPSSLAGVCASVVPAGFTRNENLPVGVQFICGGFEEEKLLKVSKAYESCN
jgi:aspartyl-tRNA(Asn)/glutamyl-tRNA(Gln) amidotransferase subunit A